MLLFFIETSLEFYERYSVDSKIFENSKSYIHLVFAVSDIDSPNPIVLNSEQYTDTLPPLFRFSEFLKKFSSYLLDNPRTVECKFKFPNSRKFNCETLVNRLIYEYRWIFAMMETQTSN